MLARLEQIRAKRPELRFGQLVAIVGSLAENESGHFLWDIDDADFAAALERFAGDLAGAERAGESNDPNDEASR